MIIVSKQESIPVGCVPCVPPSAVTVGGGGMYMPWGVPIQGGVPAQGVCTCRGVYLPRLCVSQHALGQTPPCEKNHRRLWKHNLSATTVADGNKNLYVFLSQTPSKAPTWTKIVQLCHHRRDNNNSASQTFCASANQWTPSYDGTPPYISWGLSLDLMNNN